MVQRVQLHMHEGTLGRYRKGGRGSSQEPENVPRSRTGQLVELSTVRTPTGSVAVATHSYTITAHTIHTDRTHVLDTPDPIVLVITQLAPISLI